MLRNRRVASLSMLFSLLPVQVYAEESLGGAITPAEEACSDCEWDVNGDGTLSILAIGNSFSVDVMEYLYPIARDLGVERIILGNLYVSGCSLKTHAVNASQDRATYTFYYNDNGTWTSTANYKISTALESQSWDYVSLQQVSSLSGVEDSYNDDLTDLASYIKAHSDAKMLWHMTWAYQRDSTHSGFAAYDGDQMIMYQAIVSAVQNRIVGNGSFDVIVPNGTAVQNSRTSFLGDTITRDGYHMSYNYGRYLTGLMFFKAVTGISVDSIGYSPSGVGELEKAIAIESVNHAYTSPFAVTASSYNEESLEESVEGYIRMELDLTKGGYWNPPDEIKYNQVITDAPKSQNYFATSRFTKEDLPVGSLIMVKSGWQYRPDAWISDAPQTGREDNVTESCVLVTDEWWGDYSLRAFNISRIGTPSLEDYDVEDILAVFYIFIPENTMGSLTLRYDDHLDMSGKSVEIVDAGLPSSYLVGYGVAENTVPDEAVIRLDEEELIACGTGTACLRIDGILTEVTVEAAPLSLLLIIGQSNMRGSEGDADQSIVCPDGMVYSTYGDDRGASNTALTAANGHLFVASALTGPYSGINTGGTTECLEGYPLNTLNEAGTGRMGPDSGIAYAWVQSTGEKVWVVNAAHGGSSITTWQKNGDNYKEAVALFSACEETLRKEIAAGHYTLSHMGYFWCQGCSDDTQTMQWYRTRFVAMHENLKNAMTFNHDSDPATPDVTLEFADILLAMAGRSEVKGYRYGIYETKPSGFFSTFAEMQMCGHRVAQLWLAASPDYPDIHIVCNLGESWLTMPDGTDGVHAYFEAHYPNGRVDYITQVPQAESWYTPTKAKDVKDSIHYNQIGYNEVGIECARNACILLGYLPDSDAETTVRFVNWTGFEDVSVTAPVTEPQSYSLIVPLTDPIYRSKSVSYECSEGLTYNDYELLAESQTVVGTLKASTGVSVTVSMDLHTHVWSDWKHVSTPTQETPGTDRRTCSLCGTEETREVDGVWTTLLL